MYVIMKTVLSAAIIAIISEIARRFPTYGGIIAALPLVSLLSIVWLYMQGSGTETLSKFALGVIWGLPATIFLLFIVYISLKQSLSLVAAIGLGIGGWLLFLLVQDLLAKYFHFTL